MSGAQEQVRSATIDRRSYFVPVPSGDIDSCIRFSKLRCLLCIISLLLACSDIPRTGLGIRHLCDILPPVTPDAGIYFGPYDYPMAHIVRHPTSNSSTQYYKGSAGSKLLSSTSVWSYKFDSVSIQLRAFVRQLGIQSTWPRCILYIEDCPTEDLTLEDTFLMLDSLVGAVHDHFTRLETSASMPEPIVMFVRSRWIDRMHQYVFSLLGTDAYVERLLGAHFNHLSPDSDTIYEACDARVPRAYRPLICDLSIPWMFTATTDGNWNSSYVAPRISLSRSLATRLRKLRKQYPLLYFDSVMFTSYLVRANSNDRRPSKWSFFRSETIEIATLIRGRSCSSPSLFQGENPVLQDSDCETVFVDDYRFERTTLETDVAHWFSAARALRVMSQGYMWLRIIALWFGCYKARSSEPKFAGTSIWLRIGIAWLTFFRIPGQVIVYSSWFPVIGYAFSHLMDTAIVHFGTDIIGASLNGTASNGFWPYVKLAMVQMRNMWYIAIMVKVFTLAQVYLFPTKWRRRHGLLTVRGGWFGWISALTVLGPYQVRSFRDSRVVEVDTVSSEASRPFAHLLTNCDYVSEFGIRLDAKMMTEVGAMFLAVVSTMKVCLKIYRVLCQRHHSESAKPETSGRSALSPSVAASVCFSQSYYLPLSVGSLYDTSTLSIYWGMGLRNNRPHQHCQTTTHNAAVTPSKSYRSRVRLRKSRFTKCGICSGGKGHWGWPCVQGCPDHDGIYQIEQRSKAVWSMVRLINLAMMSDPIIWISLAVFGRNLYLFEVRRPRTVCSAPEVALPGSQATRMLVLLPCNPQQLATEIGDLKFARAEFRLLDVVNSASVPWTLLLQCG